MAAVHCALLFTDRRFAPTAFYQAALNVFTIVAALSLWKLLGVYAFAIGYTVGAWAQLAHRVVRGAFRPGYRAARPRCQVHWREILAKPAFFVVYAAGLGSEHHVHARLRHARRSGHGRGARLLHARRGRAAGAPGEPRFPIRCCRRSRACAACSACARPSG